MKVNQKAFNLINILSQNGHILNLNFNQFFKKISVQKCILVFSLRLLNYNQQYQPAI